MPLHPQAKAILEALAAEGGKPIEEMTPQEVRASRAQNAEAMAAMAGPEQAVARVENRSIPGPGGPIPVRIYWPLAGQSLPALVMGAVIDSGREAVADAASALRNAFAASMRAPA